MRVYFAGPLFTPYERSYIDECVARLRSAGKSDPAKTGIVGLLTDLRSKFGHEGHGLNLFVEGCIDAGGTIVGSVDEVIEVLEGWRA